MSELPEFDREGTTDTQQKARQLLPWLPDPHICDCGELCEADQTFDPVQCLVVDCWSCPSCGSEYYRERY